ncbi:hypothetical protein [Streptomyces venezuelae]|uniref:hypothetical protein n=1 Tax=Streptomyces venezuelae TaxID=54571 RepID=UPI00123B1C1B|nr:hypothetical protein [Streptomyces venezuelae]
MARLDRLGWKRSRAVLVSVPLCAVLTAGCTSSNGTADEKSQSPAPTVSAAPTKSASIDPAEAAKAEAIATYRQYWAETVRLFADPHANTSDGLKRYAASEALSKAETSAANLKARGRQLAGQPVVGNPTVTAVALDRQIPSVKLSSCMDVSNWHLVEKANGQPVPVPSERLVKYVVATTAEKWPDGWKIIRDEPQEGQPC